MAEIAKECGISEPTVKDWLSILESTYVIFLLRPYHSNRIKRLVKSSKVYFVDTGLLCYLLGIDQPNRFLRASERGHIFENMVIAEFIKRAATQAGHTDFYFYRSASGVEVDLLMERKGEMFAYEVKFSKTLRKEMAEPLSTFIQDHPVKKAIILSLQEKRMPIAQGITGQHWSVGIATDFQIE
jgi:predicted AAA+ superfamily ATPase